LHPRKQQENLELELLHIRLSRVKAFARMQRFPEVLKECLGIGFFSFLKMDDYPRFASTSTVNVCARSIAISMKDRARALG
jgi:hypothetical protein